MSLVPPFERQLVHRMYTLRWTPGFIHHRIQGPFGDDAQGREAIAEWGVTLREAHRQIGPFVVMIDTTSLAPIPHALRLPLIAVMRSIEVAPRRRAVITSDGKVGDQLAETAQLITAGSLRNFRPDQNEVTLEWLAGAGTIDLDRLRRFLA